MAQAPNNQGLYNAPISAVRTRVPTVNDDASDGFTVGSLWFNTGTSKVYIAMSVAIGAASWILLNTDAPTPTAPNYIPYAIGWLLGANMNTTADQPFTMLSGIGAKYQITSVIATNPSGSTTGAIGGIYLAPAKAGTALVVAGTGWSSLSGGVNSRQAPALNSSATALVQTSTPILSLSTPLGSAATCDMYIFGNPLNGATPS